MTTRAPSPDDVLAAWRQREAELRPRFAPPGLSHPDQVRGKTGLEIFQAMLEGALPPPPISATLGFLLVEAERGRAVFQGQPLFQHYNPLGSVHGGWIATLLDSAVACAIHTMLPPGKSYTTVELKVNYVKALTEKVPLVRAIGQAIHVGGRLATSDGRLLGPDGTLYAHASTTCFILDVPPPTSPRS
ncbi:PaaI family thioesterase [Caldimonas thermodepolymerans]|jgi:uncharacterized domain 1|uniref:PaaI family thioesterase n=1 Tax=Caldimonas thermodepolymerans TaxID=215580 RepID=UPI00249386A2|nr:PaaI family thioesterase [Caldimonas thermodepolymerans]